MGNSFGNMMYKTKNLLEQEFGLCAIDNCESWGTINAVNYLF